MTPQQQQHVMVVKPISDMNGPGWFIDGPKGSIYLLWAPKDSRPLWSACWQRKNGYSGNHRRGASAEEVLAMFPKDSLGVAARELLLAASATRT